MKDRLNKIIKYLTEDIWQIQKFELSRPHVIIINTIRIIYLAAKGFYYDKCSAKSSSLTFYSLLSVVPLLALMLGIATAFGLEKVVESEIINRLSNQQEVLKYVLDIAKNYFSKTNETLLIGMGVALLFWSLIRLMTSIEQSFNDIFEVTRARNFARKITDYITILIVAIFFLVSTSSMVVFVANKFSEYHFLQGYIGSAMNLLLPFVLMTIVFTLLYIIMPNTKVKFGSALVGGIVAAILFQLLQYYYIHFQVGVSRYNSIYGSFAALPLFLIWLNSSWLIVMLGAEVAFAVQNVNSYEFEADTSDMSIRDKKIVALIICHNVVDRFKKKQTPSNSLQMSQDLKLPVRLLNEIIVWLLKARLINEINPSKHVPEEGFIPAVDINTLTTQRVISMLDEAGENHFNFENTQQFHKFNAIIERFSKEISTHDCNKLLKDM